MSNLIIVILRSIVALPEYILQATVAVAKEAVETISSFRLLTAVATVSVNESSIENDSEMNFGKFDIFF